MPTKTETLLTARIELELVDHHDGAGLTAYARVRAPANPGTHLRPRYVYQSDATRGAWFRVTAGGDVAVDALEVSRACGLPLTMSAEKAAAALCIVGEVGARATASGRASE